MSISAKRRSIIIANMNTPLKKVFNCVPKQTTWNANQIAHELKRQHTSVSDKTSIIGCLNSLKDSKIISEPKPGYFKQVECKEMPAKKEKETNLFDSPFTQKSENPVQDLYDIVKKFDVLKSELETAILNVEEYVDNSTKKVEKLTQLQNLLKSINE